MVDRLRVPQDEKGPPAAQTTAATTGSSGA